MNAALTLVVVTLLTWLTLVFGHNHGHGGGSYQNQYGGVAGNGKGIGAGLGQGHGQGYGQDYYAKPQYQYSYGVNDHHTGDIKTANEQRDGDVTKGHYALREPDGSWRTVNYVADYDGFRANVVRTPSAQGYGKGY